MDEMHEGNLYPLLEELDHMRRLFLPKITRPEILEAGGSYQGLIYPFKNSNAIKNLLSKALLS